MRRASHPQANNNVLLSAKNKVVLDTLTHGRVLRLEIIIHVYLAKSLTHSPVLVVQRCNGLHPALSLPHVRVRAVWSVKQPSQTPAPLLLLAAV